MIRISPAAPQDYQAALELLFDRQAPDERRNSVKDLLRSLSGGRIVRHGLLAAWNDRHLVGSILYAIQRDRTAFVWPPRIRGDRSDPAISDELTGALRSGVDTAGAWIAQALLDPAAHDDAEALDRNGFDYLTDLRFLVHLLPGVQVNEGARSWDIDSSAASPPAPLLREERGEEEEAIERVLYQPGVHDERFARLLERTYIGTRDCPEVGGRRTGADALVSHQMSGEFDPARWTLYRVAGKDAGILLLNAHPEHSAWEVVYVGVAHDCRGLGLGRRMMIDALAETRNARQTALLLAVDSRNDYASKVYDELGFVETDRKGVHVYFPATRAATRSSR
jgi:ribosomal protein S18 acetylase RimI-like enzyme